jgi:REP element-mobilizing transposase RayT
MTEPGIADKIEGMARPLRIDRPGGWYHVTARGNEGKSIFRDYRDRRHFLELLAEMVSRFAVRLHAFVLMDNHYHLVLEYVENAVREKGNRVAFKLLTMLFGNF